MDPCGDRSSKSTPLSDWSMICCASRFLLVSLQAFISGTAGKSSILSRNRTRELERHQISCDRCVTTGTSTTSCLHCTGDLSDQSSWMVVASLCIITGTSTRQFYAGGNLPLHAETSATLSMSCTWSTPAIFSTFGSSGIWWCTPLSMSTTFSRDSRNCSGGIFTVFRTVCTARGKGTSVARLGCPSLCR